MNTNFFFKRICISADLCYTLIMKKKEIIELLEKADKATITFGGFKSREAVNAAREAIIGRWTRRVEAYKKTHPDEELNFTITDKEISAGGQFQFLPAYPRHGEVVTMSKGFIVAGVHCDYGSIVPESITETETFCAFITNSGSTIIFDK